MTLAPGSRVGSYEVLTPIGSGGMGEVWKARDTKLGRDVALKILPALFTDDADRLARFRREAQLLASLNHPNIGAIYGLEEQPAALVLEFIDGPTLADRIARGPVPLEEALPIARQLTEALEAAHAQGIVHRDLKPSNVKVRPDGTVKVLDFGLAKAMDVGSGWPGGAAGPGGLSMSPTMTSPAMTQLGVILGTAAYMSPEQARGAFVDARTDIWSFGIIVFEMLVGKTLFEGATVSDTLAAVLRADVEWARLPTTVPPALRRLLGRCLERDVKRRLQHIGDARLELDDAHDERSVVAVTARASRRWPLAAAAALISAAIAGALAWTLRPPPPPARSTSFIVRTASNVPVTGASLFPLALSPDGRDLVYAVGLEGSGLGAVTQLFHQRFDEFEPRLIANTGGTGSPFFSPQGDAVGFYSQSAGELQQVRLSGGSPERIRKTPFNLGASWGTDGTLVFGIDWGLPLQIARRQVSDSSALTRLDLAAGEGAHLWPQVLPGNRAALFTVWTKAPSWDEAKLAVADLETGRHTVVLSGGTSGLYAASGHLVFWRGGALMAAPFDLDALRVTGEAVKVVPDVRLATSNGGAHFALSQTGTLAYVKGGADPFSENRVVERSGKEILRLDDTQPTANPVFSPDGKRIAITLLKGGTFGIGVFDLTRRLLTPLPLAGDNAWPGWAADGSRVTFQSNAAGDYDYYWMPADGSGKPERLTSGNVGFVPSRSVSTADGRQLLFVKRGETSGLDIWVTTSGQPAAQKSLIATAANETRPALSPDGRFVAYQSDESGTPEIYVRPFPNVEVGRELVSRSGGTTPRWRHDGKEILYVADKGIMSVPVLSQGTSTSPGFGQPSLEVAMTGLSDFDVSPDGRLLAIARVPVEKAATEIHVIVNWFEDLKRLAPGKR